SFFRVIFVSKPASDCSDPVFGQLWNFERGEAPAARQVVLRLLQALVLQECIDNQLGIFSRIISHLIHLCLPISCFLVAFGSRADLLLRAKHLFVAAIVAGAAEGTGLGPGIFASAAAIAHRVPCLLPLYLWKRLR